ncbi:MAG: hypothetical protein ACFCUX_01265 [Candidatus Methylacidiphilales bacterium]
MTSRRIFFILGILLLIPCLLSAQNTDSYSENYNWSRRPVDAAYDPGLRIYAPARPNRGARTDTVIKAGPIQLRSDVGLRTTYTDNIALSQNNRRDDIILTPYANLGLQWPLTDINSLNLTLGIYRDNYLFHPEESSDGIGIAPTSALEFWIYAGEHFRFVIFDHFALQEDTIDEPTLQDRLGFSRFTNTAGITGYWSINENLTASLGYRYTTIISLNDRFNFLDRDTHAVDTSLSYKLGPDTTIGGFANTGYTTYEQNVNNDSLVHTVGVFGDTRITDYIRGNLSVSYNIGSFDSGGSNGDSSDLGEVSVNGILSHRINQVMSHSLGAGRASRLGTNSNFYNMYYVRHSADWEVFRDLSLGTNAFVELSDESGGNLNESFTRWGAGIRSMYRWNMHLTTALSYQFIDKDSNRPNRDYYNNRVTLDINYRF